MKVVAINGSPNAAGNTYHALKIMADVLEAQGMHGRDARTLRAIPYYIITRGVFQDAIRENRENKNSGERPDAAFVFTSEKSHDGFRSPSWPEKNAFQKTAWITD